MATKIGERCGKADVMECVKGPERVGWKNIKNKGLDGGFKKKPMRRPLFPFFFFSCVVFAMKRTLLTASLSAEK